VQSGECRVSGSESETYDICLRVKGLGFRFTVYGLGFTVWGLGLRV
jgi:hypothetical protein